MQEPLADFSGVFSFAEAPRSLLRGASFESSRPVKIEKG